VRIEHKAARHEQIAPAFLAQRAFPAELNDNEVEEGEAVILVSIAYL
jgi:hypothetical protein